MTRENGKTRSSRGFAAMDENLQRQIAAAGGREAHRRGTAHEWTPQEAAEAGRKGGRARGSAKNSRAKQQTEKEYSSISEGGRNIEKAYYEDESLRLKNQDSSDDADESFENESKDTSDSAGRSQNR